MPFLLPLPVSTKVWRRFNKSAVSKGTKATFRKDKIKKMGEREVGHDIKPKEARGPALSSIKVEVLH
jgi:hypothetical protein